eukprot:671879-Rhodomonas_salina.1
MAMVAPAPIDVDAPPDAATLRKRTLGFDDEDELERVGEERIASARRCCLCAGAPLHFAYTDAPVLCRAATPDVVRARCCSVKRRCAVRCERHPMSCACDAAVSRDAMFSVCEDAIVTCCRALTRLCSPSQRLAVSAFGPFSPDPRPPTPSLRPLAR